MKYYIFLLFLLFFTSCENEAPVKTVYSYFRGDIDGQKVCVEQSSAHDIRFCTVTTSEYRGGEQVVYGWVMHLSESCDAYKEPPLFSIQLAPLHEGEYDISKGHAREYESCLSFVSGKGRYVPMPEKPFKLSVVTIVRATPRTDTPYVRGTMEGVLYNEKNPRDSVVVCEAVFRLVPGEMIMREEEWKAYWD